MEKLPNDLLIKIALELDYPGIIALCATSKSMNNIICQNQIFWMNKFVKEFPNNRVPNNPKKFYRRLIIGKNSQIFDQLFRWIRDTVGLTNLDDNRENLKNNLPYELKHSYTNFTLEESMDDEQHEDHWDENEIFVRLIPDNISLDSDIYLPNNICLINTLGIYEDNRGTLDNVLEFGDFHAEWRLNRGLYKVYDIANAFYKIKSHKFDKWYEMVNNMVLYRYDEEKDCIEIEFDIDHGS